MQPVSIKQEYIAKAEADAKKNNQEIVFKGAVNKINDKGKGTKPRILILTKQYICYYRNDDKATCDRQHYWNHIKKYNSKLPEIDLEFEGDKTEGNDLFRFTTRDAEMIQRKIFDILCHVLSEDELASLDLRRFNIPKYTINGLGIRERYYSVLAQDQKKGSKSIERQLLEYLPTYNKTFKLKSDDNLGDYIVPLCQALAPYTPLESLIIPPLMEGSNLYENLNTIFLVLNLQIRHLSLSTQPDNEFGAFTSSLKGAKKLEALTFRDITMSKENFQFLQNAIPFIENFRCLAFQNVLKKSSIDDFVDEFLTGYVTKNLRMFNLDGTKGLDVSKVIKDLPVINSLSFADCNLDINKTLETISEANLKNLRYLNLSGNHGKNQISDDLELPEELTRLDVNNVDWEDGVFSTFIEAVFNHQYKKGLNLYIENTHASEEDWENALHVLDTIDNFPLNELGWSGNAISESLLSFLQKNTKLATLFISGTFSYDKEEQFNSFVDSINDIRSLKNLVIKGVDDNYLGEKIYPLFQKLVDHPSLSLLDVSNQQIGNDGIRELSNLVERRSKLQYLIFDNAKFDNLPVLNELAKCAQERMKPISVQYPIPDLKEIAEVEKDKQKRNQLLKDMSEIKRTLELARKAREAPTQESQKPNISMLKAADLLKKGANRRNPRERSFSLRVPNLKANLSKDSSKAAEADEYQDPNYTIFSGPFDYYVSEFTDEFPLYISDKLQKDFDIGFKSDSGSKSSRSKHHSRSKKEKHSKHSKQEEQQEEERPPPIKTRDVPVRISAPPIDENEEEEWVEEEEIPDGEEEEEPEPPSHLSALYREMKFNPPQYSGLVDRIGEQSNAHCLLKLRENTDLTPFINQLVP